MQKCDYCGFVTKYNLNHCPSCGATQYTKMDNFNNYEIEDCSNFKFKCFENNTSNNSVLYYIACFLFMIFPFVIVICHYCKIDILIFDYLDTKYVNYVIDVFSIICYLVILLSSFSKRVAKDSFGMLTYMVLVIPWIYWGLFNESSVSIMMYCVLFYLGFFIFLPIIGIGGIKELINNNKNKSIIKNGYLIKNVKYELVPDQSNSSYKRIKVNYTSKDGVNLELISTQCINYVPLEDTVDILIDRNNLNNYYIDFEIV